MLCHHKCLLRLHNLVQPESMSLLNDSPVRVSALVPRSAVDAGSRDARQSKLRERERQQAAARLLGIPLHSLFLSPRVYRPSLFSQAGVWQSIASSFVSLHKQTRAQAAVAAVSDRQHD